MQTTLSRQLESVHLRKGGNATALDNNRNNRKSRLVLVKSGSHQHAAFHFRRKFLIEREIPKRVKNSPATVDFVRLDDVRMRAYYKIGSSVYEYMRLAASPGGSAFSRTPPPSARKLF